MLHALLYWLLGRFGSAFCVVLHGGDEDDMGDDSEMLEPCCVGFGSCLGLSLGGVYVYLLTLEKTRSVGWWILMACLIDLGVSLMFLLVTFCQAKGNGSDCDCDCWSSATWAKNRTKNRKRGDRGDLAMV